MCKAVTDLIQRIDRQKAELLSELDAWPEARLAFRPNAGAWTAVEMLDHLVKTETEIGAAARRGTIEPHRIGLRDRLGVRFIERVFQSERRVKVPKAAAQVLPTVDVRMEDVVGRWNGERKELAKTVEALAPEQLVGGVFRHPVGGWMSWLQVLQFFSVHILHHEFQLRRIRESSQETG